MRYLGIILIVGFLFSCEKFKVQYKEDPVSYLGENTNFKYYSTVIEDPEKVFSLPQNLMIVAKDRNKNNYYCKVYLDQDGTTPIRIENYKKDGFNTHLYYAYLIFDIIKKEGKVTVKITRKDWVNGDLITVKTEEKQLEQGGEITIVDLIQIYKTNPADMTILNKIIKTDFLTIDSDANKKKLAAVAADQAFLFIDGYHPDYKDIKIKLFFFDEKRGDAAGLVINKGIPIIARISKMTADGLEFTYIDFDKETIKKREEESKLQDSFYKTK